MKRPALNWEIYIKTTIAKRNLKDADAEDVETKNCKISKTEWKRRRK